MERKERAGITRNVSAGGVLFHSASRFALGQHLELRFRAPLTAPTHMRSEIQLTGTVVRVATDARDTAFRHLTAVKFDEPTPTLTA